MEDIGATVLCDIDHEVATITLNRERVLNCLNEEVIRDLNSALDRCEVNPTLRVIELKGAGRAFCSGIDLQCLATDAISDSFFRKWELLLTRIESLNALVVAIVQSHCIGGGLQLALACDLRVATVDASFGITAVAEGIVPGMGMWRLARYAGLGRAKRLALTGDVISCQEAHQWGLVDYVVPSGEQESQISRLREQLLKAGATSSRLTKKLLNIACQVGASDFMEIMCQFQTAARASSEHHEAMMAYRVKRDERAKTQTARS